MTVCCCALAGTNACLNCVNMGGHFPFYNHQPYNPWKVQPYKQPEIQPYIPNPEGIKIIDKLGWICPKCGKVNAPTVLTCNCSGKGQEDG